MSNHDIRFLLATIDRLEAEVEYQKNWATSMTHQAQAKNDEIDRYKQALETIGNHQGGYNWSGHESAIKIARQALNPKD